MPDALTLAQIIPLTPDTALIRPVLSGHAHRRFIPVVRLVHEPITDEEVRRAWRGGRS